MQQDDIYMEGLCHVLAVALHRSTGSSFLLLCEQSGDYRHPHTGDPVPSVHHVYAVRTDGVLVDARGEHDAEDVKAQWLSLGDGQRRNPFTAVPLESEDDLADYVGAEWDLPLSCYDDAAVADAMAFLDSSPTKGV